MKQTRTKADLAKALGISATTLRKWLEPYLEDLKSMGVNRNAKTLTPKAVKFLTKEFDIDW
jgi:transposase-like protein